MTVELVAPKVGGVTLSDGNSCPRRSEDRRRAVGALRRRGRRSQPAAPAELLANDAAAKDFVADAFAHGKFVGYVEGATELIGAAGVVPDDGFVRLEEADGVTQFFSVAANLRLWLCETLVHQI